MSAPDQDLDKPKYDPRFPPGLGSWRTKRYTDTELEAFEARRQSQQPEPSSTNPSKTREDKTGGIDPAIAAAIKKQFGDVPELNPSPQAFIKYRLVEYSHQNGIVRFEEAPRSYAWGETRPEYFVDYVVVDPRTQLVARRQIRYSGFRDDKYLAEAEVEYRQDSLRIKYEVEHDNHSKEHQPQSANIEASVVPTLESGLHFNLELAETRYWGSRATSVYMTYGDPQSLEKYYVRKMAREKRIQAAAVFGGHDLSKPGADFEIKGTDFSGISFYHFGRFGLGLHTFRAKVQLGEVFARPEIAPYSFLLSRDAGQIRLLRACGLCEGEWTYLSPDGLDLEKFDKLISSEDLSWVNLYKSYPARLDMKEGIRPCHSDSDVDEDGIVLPLP